MAFVILPGEPADRNAYLAEPDGEPVHKRVPWHGHPSQSHRHACFSHIVSAFLKQSNQKYGCFSFLGISQSLPATSYIKLIEIWMIFTMIYPFAETLLVCIKDMHKSKAILVKGMIIFHLSLNHQNSPINYFFHLFELCYWNSYYQPWKLGHF